MKLLYIVSLFYVLRYALGALDPFAEIGAQSIYLYTNLYLALALLLTLTLRYFSRFPYRVSGHIAHQNAPLMAYLCGGAARLVQASLFKLSVLGVVEVSAHRSARRIGPLPPNLKSLEELIYYLTPEDHEVTFHELELKLIRTGALERYEERLREAGFIIQGQLRQLLIITASTLSILCPYLIFEAASERLIDEHVLGYGLILSAALSVGLYGAFTSLTGGYFSQSWQLTVGAERWLRVARAYVGRRPARSLEIASVLLAMNGAKALRQTSFAHHSALLEESKPDRLGYLGGGRERSYVDALRYEPDLGGELELDALLSLIDL